MGGGLAGMAAAAALGERGFRVELFEASRRLGGRAASFRDSVSGELVDCCQHVSMGCSTNLADFLRRTGTSDCFGRFRRLHFIGPDGKQYRFSSAPLLPAPLHLVPGLLRLGYLHFADRLRILRTMSRLAKLPADLEDEAVTVGSWLRRQGEPDRAIERFWSVVLTSALSETVDRASLAAARKVFVDGFLASRRAYELEIPRMPLEEIFDGRVAERLSQRGVTLHRGVRVEQIEGDARHARSVVLSDGSRRPFDFFVVAVPWRAVGTLFPPTMLDELPSLADVERIEPAPITAVHLWFDRPITRLPHAALVGRLSQWVFRGSRVAARGMVEGDSPIFAPRTSGQSPSCFSAGLERSELGHYYQVVVSASHELVGCRSAEVVSRVRAELDAIWPAARQSRLLHSRVITHRAAVFSVQPGIDHLRPPQETAIKNLALAGDWTATGWPATMESAVRSGYLAAEVILNRTSPDNEHRLLTADLPMGRLARCLLKKAATRIHPGRRRVAS
ncbi:MAG: hydroxysqualene dehydroxylase HpnE [Planctomycetota bacterium]